MKKVIYQSSSVNRFLVLTFVILSFVLTSFAQTSKLGIADEVGLVSEFDVNGLKVLLKRRESAPTVAAGLFVRGGARNINEKNAGIENFMLQVATEGSRKYPREAVRRDLAAIGSGISAGANNDYSVMSMASTRENFDKTWDIFTDLALNPTFEAGDVERVRTAIITGLRDEEVSADNYLDILQDRIIYADHPYANEVSGTIETVTDLNAKDLNDYHKKVMQTSQLLLVVVGDIDAGILRKKIAGTLGKLPRGNYKEESLPEIDFSRSTLDVVERDLPTNYVQGVFKAPSLSNPDYSAMRVAMAILQANVYQEVRLKRQLSYAPNADLNSSAANTAFIYVTAVDANQSVKLMLDEINNLKTLNVNKDYISTIGGNSLTIYYLDQQTNGAQAAELAKYELIGGGWRNSFDFLNRILEVTPADVQRVSQKYMTNIRFIVIGDPKAINEGIFLQK